MPTSEAIYTVNTCPNPAFQLIWSVDFFWHNNPAAASSWFEKLKQSCEPDGIRILNHRVLKTNVSQFLVSTPPSVAPVVMVKKMKGRLQADIRTTHPNAFRRNYCVRSIGSADRETIEGYLSKQLEHHPMADKRVEEQFRDFQFKDLRVDLKQPSFTSHAMYWYNLQLVLVNASRYRDINLERAARRLQTVKDIAAKKRYWLHQVGLLPDHLHISFRADIKDAPEEIALSFMNNLAYRSGMIAELSFSYYVGTFGEYSIYALGDLE
jgi:REP element-mobilizing transposase RayT